MPSPRLKEKEDVILNIAKNINYLKNCFLARGGKLIDFYRVVGAAINVQINDRTLLGAMELDREKNDFRSDWSIWIAVCRKFKRPHETTMEMLQKLMFCDLESIDALSGIER